MKRRHEMPFGAERRDDGSVRFRLWAPSAREIKLKLHNAGGQAPLRLHRLDDGWFELATDGAGVGTGYQFVLENGLHVPDPASRFQPDDVNGPSQIIDPQAFDWQDQSWCGRPWEEAVIYELHVGTFTPEGTFAGVRERLDYLAELGVTAIELMPVADFPGLRNWGYDGVLPFAPDSTYGTPEELKELVQAVHARGLMIFLDVVYNHFGPEGNYLHSYAPQFFTDRHNTPWGQAINFDGAESRTVRDFFIHNAIYWLNEYHFDGLRLDAVHAIVDDSEHHILAELAEKVRMACPDDRYIHLILENDSNQARYLRRGVRCRPQAYTAQWNDDIHHAAHVLVTGEREGYYCDYSDPIAHLGRCLIHGFAYQGEISLHRGNQPRGEPTEGLPLTAFVSFLQNHDQVGNRAFGERITSLADTAAVRAAAAILLLAPSPPLLFMGEEFAAESPFLYFCDFKGDLATAVRDGRRGEFAHFAAFSNPAARERIPDPNAAATFERSALDWETIGQPPHQEWMMFYRRLLKLRREAVEPHLSGACRIGGKYNVRGDRGLTALWHFPDHAELALIANLGPELLPGFEPASAPLIYATNKSSIAGLGEGTLPPWSVLWFLKT